MIFLANFKTDTSFQSARTAVITMFTWPRREVVKAHRTLYDPTTIRLDLGQIAKHAGSRSVTFPSRRSSRITSREDLTVESLQLSRSGAW